MGLFDCDVGIVAAVAIALIGSMYYMGIFQMMRFVEGYFPKTYVYGLAYKGSYQNIGPAFEKVENTMKEKNLKYRYLMGIYHDDSMTKPENLRSFVAAAFSEPLPDSVAEELTSLGFLLREVEPLVGKSTYFPFRNMFSYMLAPSFVYPRLTKEFKKLYPDFKEDGPKPEGGIIEIYLDDSIEFFAPVYDMSALAPIPEHWN